MTELSTAEQIKRLEALPDQTTAPESAGDLAFAITVLQNHYTNVIERQELAEELEDQSGLVEALTKKLADAAAGMEEVTKQRDHYQDQCEKMLKMHNKHVTEAGAELVKIDRVNKAQAEELKQLRALNPQRLSKQVKELQKKIKIQTEANGKQVAEVKRLKQLSKDAKRLADDNIKLRKDNHVLDMALTEAAKDINQGVQIVALWEEGDWGIYPSERESTLLVVDKTTDIARSYSAAQNLIKARPVPAKIQTQCDTILTKLVAIRADMPDYRQSA